MRHSPAAWRAVGLDQGIRQNEEKQEEDEYGSWQQFIHRSCHLFTFQLSSQAASRNIVARGRAVLVSL